VIKSHTKEGNYHQQGTEETTTIIDKTYPELLSSRKTSSTL